MRQRSSNRIMTSANDNEPLLACRLHSITAQTSSASDGVDDNNINTNRYIGASSINSHCIINRMAKNKHTNNILWSLVLYSLIHLTANIILTNHNHQHHNYPANSNIKYVHQHQTSYRDDDHDIHCPIEHLNQISQLNENRRQASHCLGQKQLQSSSSSSSCSSKTKISSSVQLRDTSHLGSLTSSIPKLATTYLSSVNSFAVHLCQSLFGSRILVAQAAPNGLYQLDQDKDIIVLNSTNFNSELIQYNHPFPHIKLIEYYLPYCGICLKFKTTYTQLAREIHTWRNVIRPSAIDLGVSSNSPIAHSWSIEVVPTLRIHPPLNASLAAKLDKQLSTWSSMKSSSANDLQRAMHEEYSGANLSISSLDVFKYTIDTSHKRESLAEKVPLLKYDLVRYIERYVQKYPADIPATWPNFNPVTDTSLIELRKRHPREELFLIVEAGNGSPGIETGSNSDQGSSPSLGLRVMLELSSSPAWRAVRYVRASENRALIEDVIAEKRREEVEASGGEESQAKKNGDTNGASSTSEQVKLLASLLEGSKAATYDGINNLILVHIDNFFGHQPLTPKSHPITIVTGSDLVTVERSAHLHQQSQYPARSRRSDGSPVNQGSQIDSLQRKIELIVLYVKQIYSETKEDRAFVEALKSLDEDPTSFGLKREAIEKFQATTTSAIAAAATTKASVNADETNQISYSASDREYDRWADNNLSGENKFTGLIKSLNPFNSSRSSLFLSSSDNICQAANYDNKLKSLRYMLFTEVPRVSLIDKSLVEKQEKLNTLSYLVAVIKSYFPLPDSASIQFIDTIQAYLNRQQSIYSSINLQDKLAAGSSTQYGFDTLAFKQELKRAESDGKQLPEIRRWKSQCALGEGQLPDIWSIFFTMTAFEYKKLNQIYQQKSSLIPAPAIHSAGNPSLSLETQLLPSGAGVEAQQHHDTKPITLSSSPISPVERLVSPPSTTTSLSLTIATPVASKNPDGSMNISQASRNAEAELPIPVILVLRDYLTNFHDKTGRARRFKPETTDLNLEGIRQQPAEFSLLWLWETYNRISKRLSVDSDLHPMVRPKDWFPTYEQCKECYKKPPSFLNDPTIEPSAIFLESIEWDKREILSFLLREFTWQPMDNNNGTNIFGYQVPYGCMIVIGVCSLVLIVLLRFASCYIERQRRHKASLLNGNGAHYSVELQ